MCQYANETHESPICQQKGGVSNLHFYRIEDLKVKVKVVAFSGFFSFFGGGVT